MIGKKDGDPHLPDSYRPISLLNSIGKLVENWSKTTSIFS